MLVVCVSVVCVGTQVQMLQMYSDREVKKNSITSVLPPTVIAFLIRLSSWLPVNFVDFIDPSLRQDTWSRQRVNLLHVVIPGREFIYYMLYLIFLHPYAFPIPRHS